uniref:Ubiquitin-like protease family profile domain-containing protein n=1 Tax=Brassica campestris TaxID=3711 RepID=A0A3P6D7X3_BRACM|nr:unnamed protein product [Brassica rapa]
METTTAKVIIPNQRKARPGYNPFANPDRQKLSALLDWVKLDPKWRQKVKGSSSDWFYILLTPTKWLIDTHMDAGINLLRLDTQSTLNGLGGTEFACWMLYLLKCGQQSTQSFWPLPPIPTAQNDHWAVKPIAHMLPYMLRMLSTGAERELYLMRPG